MAGLEERVLDRYELQRLIGSGGMADVYLGYDPRFDREVAIKVFKRDDEDLLRRFIREARLMASLNNAHLMPVYDAGTSELDQINRYYIVMPYMSGGTLRTLVRRAPLPLTAACRYLDDIANALDYMHVHGVIHRDIKSSNVLLDARKRCYLSDFGIARTSTDATQTTSTGSVLGTADYIAPELFESNRKADVRSDLYSLGVLLFEMVTGHLPFTGESQLAVVAMHMSKQPPSPRSFVPTIPLQVERVVLKALEKRPELRYGSASELAQAFCEAVNTPVAYPVDQTRAASSVRGQSSNAPSLGGSELEGRVILPPVMPALPTTSLARSTSEYQGRVPSAYSPPQPPVRRKKPASTRTRVVVILALLALMAVVGPIVYVLLTYARSSHPVSSPTATAVGANQTVTSVPPSSPTPNQTATAQAIAATATQQAKNATATAIAGTTATARAQASATVGVIQTATAGASTYSDPLNDANSAATQAAQWDQTSHCVFKSDGYHVIEGTTGLLNAGLLRGCLEAGKQFQNFAVTVDVTILSGHSGGLFFRVGPKTLGAYSGYLFEIDSKGNYKISLSSNFSTGNGNKILQDWTNTTALKTGSTAKNTLQVIARNNNLLFYINGVFLSPPVQDTTFTSGDIALLATTIDNGANADIVYSNLNIYNLS